VASLNPNTVDITGPWVPLTEANCAEGQGCGNSTLMIRTTFQLSTLPNVGYVENLFVGSGNCSEPGFLKSVIMVVESLGTFVIDYDAVENDSFPINFSPQSQTVPSPESQTIPSPEPEIPQPFILLSPEPEPQTQPQPFVLSPEPEPQTQPQPFVLSPESSTIPVPSPSPSIFEEPEPSPSTFEEPEPESEPSPSTTNFSVWLPVILTPTKFQITIVSEGDIFYTGAKDGPCMPIIDYWANDTLGCPCNGTWEAIGSIDSDDDGIITNGRVIQPGLCPNSSCPESFFINETVKYGKVRVNQTVYENGTVDKTIEITSLSSIKEIGYAFGEKDIMFAFLLPNKNATPSEGSPSPYPGSPSPPEVELPGPIPVSDTDSSGAPIPLATTITMLFVFLLMMYENTQ